MTLRSPTVAVITSGIIVGATFYPLVLLLLSIPRDIGLCHNFGCGLAFGFAALLVALLTSGLLLGVLLKTFAVPRPWVIGCLAAANVGAAFELTHVINLSPLIVYPVCFSLFVLLHFWICQRFRHTMRSIGAGFAIVIVSFPIFTVLGKEYGYAQFRRQQLKETQGIGFKLYAPTFLPSGYHLVSAGPYRGYANYYQLDYVYHGNNPGDPQPFTIYQFKQPPEYHPPENCGEFSRLSKSEITRPCQLWDASEDNKIYYAEPLRSNLYGFFMAKGDVLVTMQVTTGEVDRAALIHVLRSLQEVSPESLAVLKDAARAARQVP